MEGIDMTSQDLIELFQLLHLYRRTYLNAETQDNVLEVLSGISRAYQRITHGDILEARNPRGAGRKRKYTEIENQKIREMHRAGMSIRKIANEAHCSPGHVQDVIHESTNPRPWMYEY